MVQQQIFLSREMETQILREIVTCFDHARDDREAIFHCMTKFARKFSNLSFYTSEEVIQFTKDALRITTILFQEHLAQKDTSEINVDELGNDERKYYKYQLKQICTI